MRMSYYVITPEICTITEDKLIVVDTTGIPKIVDDNHFNEYNQRLSSNLSVEVI